MPKRSLPDQLEQLVAALLVKRDTETADPDLAPLLRIAGDLRDLPRENFKARLRSGLEKRASMASQVESLAPVRQTATPRLRIRDAAAAIEFYKKAFGAREIMRFVGHGQIGHAEIEIGNSVIMLGEAAPEYGFPGPETYGGSPMSIHLYVPDVDAFITQAVGAGARLVSPVRDQFYGDRGGSVADPFGYTWGVATRREMMPVEEMQRRFAAMEKEEESGKTAASFIPEGLHTVTPYLVVQDAPAMIEFVKQVFDAEERFRAIGSAGGIHADIRIADSALMIGGGAPDLSWRGESHPAALHIFVEDADAVYARALQAGAISIQEPADQFYGERSGSVRDPFGNNWYIATNKGERHVPEGLRTVTPYLHPLRAEPVINFLKRGLGGEEVARYVSPDGVIHHAKIRIGDSIIEMGEAHGPYQPMSSMFYVYVPDVNAAYHRALQAGGLSIAEPADQTYGARTAGVKDVFGNQWYLANAH